MIDVLAVQGLSVSYRARQVLQSFNLGLQTGITVLLGPNAAGKTTILSNVAALRIDRSISITLNSQPVTTDNRRSLQRSLGFMPQRWSPIAGFSARECVEYAAWLKGASRPEQRMSAQRAIEHVGLSDVSGVKASRLSGGQQRRVGLAEALVMNPAVLILDEPTVGLDPAARHEFRELLRSQETQRATLLSTHLTDDTDLLADRIVVVAEGRTIFEGDKESLRALAARREDGHGGPTAMLEAGYLALVRGD